MIRKLSFFVVFVIIISCSSDSEGSDEPTTIQLVQITADNNNLISGAKDISLNPILRFTFSSNININSFENALNITPSNLVEIISVVGNNSQVNVQLRLQRNTNYTINLQGSIGLSGENLNMSLNILFTTIDGCNYITPSNGTSSSRRVVNLETNNGSGNFVYYSNYPIYSTEDDWQCDLEKAIVVVHGNSFNPDDYYSYMSTTVQALSLSESTILISPDFKNSSQNYLSWGSDYRKGGDSSGAANISSFEALDIIIDRLANKSFFPSLNEIVITGQSSGGLFTHLFSAANKSENKYPEINFEYIVSESQFYYYPTNERISESNNQLYVVQNCNGIYNWPYGYNNDIPRYLLNTSKQIFDDNFINRKITYLLGNGVSGSDGQFNNSTCYLSVLGSSRYKRGENMFQYINIKFPSNNHNKIVAQGIKHDGQAIYNSPEFRNLLNTLLNN